MKNGEEDAHLALSFCVYKTGKKMLARKRKKRQCDAKSYSFPFAGHAFCQGRNSTNLKRRRSLEEEEEKACPIGPCVPL
jgi:hypothetical protein